MAQRNHVGIELPSNPLEKLVPRLPRRILERPSLLPRAHTDVLPVGHKGPLERARHGGGELLVALRVVPKLMIEVRGPDQTDLVRGVELAQDQRESDRIRAPGKGHHHTGLSAKESVLANELSDAL